MVGFLNRRMKQIVKQFLFRVPMHLRARHIAIDCDGLRLVENAIREHYHTGWRSESQYSEQDYENDLNAHLIGRLSRDRSRVIPWLDAACQLAGKRVLEIGCGTGSSTIALSEQGARVTGIDIDQGALQVARERCRVYGVEADFHSINSQQIRSTLGECEFDVAIFFACLEHMVMEERLAALSDVWAMLPRGAFMVVVETPNRLWYFDDHTSQLPFFHWLPDELAFQYSRFSSRENFRELYTELTATSKEHFLRRGRGVSYHEFEVALGSVHKLNVVSSLSTFDGFRSALTKSKIARDYKSFLRQRSPGIHEGFCDPDLDLVLKKVS